MGIHRGPNIVKDNLVFGYDTGYGVADNSTATRFYPGENTTNNTIKTGYAWNGDGSNQSFANKGGTTITNNSLKYNGYDTVLWTPGSSLNCYLNSTPDLDYNDSSTIWTFSCYIKRDDGAAITALSVYMYYPNGDGSASGTIVDCGNGWYRVSRTRTGSNSYISLAGFTGFTSGHKYYLSGVMLTKNNHTVPYVNVQSSRSSTQSLIDLKRTADIDVSNVSFDSTGQPTFDGTNDRISLTDNFDLNDHFGNGGDFSIEAIVYMRESASQNGGVLTNQKYQTEPDPAGFGLAIRSANTYCLSLTNSTPTSYQSLASIPFNVNNYHHIVYTFKSSTGNVVAYSNGSQYSTVTNSSYSWNIPTDSTRTYIGYNPQGGWGNYINMDIPVIKVYNSVITEQEVNQNFNAYKNRFNI